MVGRKTGRNSWLNSQPLNLQNPFPNKDKFLSMSLLCSFLRLGTTAFGGPAAHIAIMEDELVRRRQWLSREKFLDLLGASNLIPGPSSSEVAIHIGYLCAGWRGLLIAGASSFFRQHLWSPVSDGSTSILASSRR